MTWYRSAARSRWRKLRRLSSAERRSLLQTCCVLPLMMSALRLLGFRRLYAALARLTPLNPREVPDHGHRFSSPYGTSCLVLLAARFSPWRPTCLPRSLALWWLLRRQGIESELRVGVRCKGTDLEAHAWVEYQGLPLNDRIDIGKDFIPFSQPITPRLGERG